MRCHEIRALCSAYLDSELDTKTSFDMEQHLRDCEGCRLFFEGERRVDERVFEALRAGGKDDALWRGIEAKLTASARPPTRAWWKVAALAAAAMVVLALSLVLWPHTPPLDLAEAVAVDHAKYLAGNMPAQFADEPPADAISFTNGRLDRTAFSLLPPLSAFQPEGKRLCHLQGVPVAWMMGRAEGRPVSVIVLRIEELSQFPDLKKRFAEGHRIACGESGGFQFAAREVGDYIICAVADAPRANLERLVASVDGLR